MIINVNMNMIMNVSMNMIMIVNMTIREQMLDEHGREYDCEQ